MLRLTAPIRLIGAVLVWALTITSALGSPDGPEWAASDDPQGCRSCHLGDPAPESADALALEGLPRRPEAGKTYELTIRLQDPALRNAGFLLSIRADNQGAPVGRLDASSDRVETNGSQVRSTWNGSLPAQAGEASWNVIWTAPSILETTLSFDLWANAGNDDLSPLGDRLHHRVWRLPDSP